MSSQVAAKIRVDGPMWPQAGAAYTVGRLSEEEFALDANSTQVHF